MHYILDALKMTEKETAHAYLQETMNLPEYYGKNLDALWDSLGELSETVVWFTHMEEAAGTYFDQILELFQEQAEENKSFFVLDEAIQNRPIQVEQGENYERLVSAMVKAADGQELTIGFFGGSITQGCLATEDQYSYAYRCYEWWEKNFPDTKFHYVNGGIGGTTSHFGVARAEKDLLMYQPDIVVVDFSVNDVGEDDCPDPLLKETYEGLMRKLLNAPSKPAVVALYNVFYDTEETAEGMHSEVNRHYGISGASMKDSLYMQLQKKTINRPAISTDGLHPNDLGHELVAYEVCRIFEVAKKDMQDRFEGFLYPSFDPEEEAELAAYEGVSTAIADLKPITANAYENSQLLNIQNCQPIRKGFLTDTDEKKGHLDCFKNGWIGQKVGDSITFEVDCSCLAVQYRKTIQKPSPIARLIVDGDEENAVILDGNFEQDWGDCLYLERILHHETKKTRKVTIEIIKASENDQNPFYLLSLIIA